ncbi:MAG: aminoacyl-tRNA hydrolase [Myxococcales bacterium]|nr:aminoacyl-tRNA hydrolase [Myxococcales bacterium]MCH7867742.1 aminoacyl-tRNA hydrolase [Myxococcales bacterium]
MRLLVGLGNPGPNHARTRHNVGFRVLDALASRHRIEIHTPAFAGHFGRGLIAGCEVGLLKPETFMNRSGSAVAAALAAMPSVELTRDLILVYDDLDLPFGRLRLRGQGGAGGHRGAADVIDALGSDGFARLRFGIGRPPESSSTIDYVLEEFSADEENKLVARIDAAVQALEASIADGIEAAMSDFNAEPSPGD